MLVCLPFTIPVMSDMIPPAGFLVPLLFVHNEWGYYWLKLWFLHRRALPLLPSSSLCRFLLPLSPQSDTKLLCRRRNCKRAAAKNSRLSLLADGIVHDWYLSLPTLIPLLCRTVLKAFASLSGDFFSSLLLGEKWRCLGGNPLLLLEGGGSSRLDHMVQQLKAGRSCADGSQICWTEVWIWWFCSLLTVMMWFYLWATARRLTHIYVKVKLEQRQKDEGDNSMKTSTLS